MMSNNSVGAVLQHNPPEDYTRAILDLVISIFGNQDIKILW